MAPAPRAHGRTSEPSDEERFSLVVVSNRLPVAECPGGVKWHESPGGLVSALRPVVTKAGGAWVGWTGNPTPVPGQLVARQHSDPGPSDEAWRPHAMGSEARLWEARLWEAGAPELDTTGEVQVVAGESPGDEVVGPDNEGVHAVAVPLSEEEVSAYYEGFCNATVWPLYHDVVAPPVYSRRWWHAYVEVNQRFASAVAAHAAPGATVWAHDYHLQLVPAMVKQLRGDLQVGFFCHIPFPSVDLFAQLPWRKEVLEGLLGADLVGFQTAGSAVNFLRACRRFAGSRTQGPLVQTPDRRTARVGAFPISVDARELSDLATTPEVRQRAQQIRKDLGEPDVVLLGVDRLDYTKGLLHRLRAYGELLSEGRLGPPEAVLVQVASPSRDEVEQYKRLREEVERVVGGINGDFSPVGRPAVHYLHQSFPKNEMAAMYLAADVALVTPLRDGMNLVAKEYVSCRPDEGGRLVLSELAGAASELREAWLVNPYDIDTMKRQIMAAVEAPDQDAAWRMRRMRRRVFAHDVHRWAEEFLAALGGTG
jgi:trehalose 6-phosphate synthase